MERTTVGPVRAAPAPARRGPSRATTDRILVVIVAIAAGFRLWALGSSRLGFDEAFTAMAGRMSFSNLFEHLRVRDSHPPLDYLLHLPLARLGVDPLVFRLPSALCSIAAVALFAWWMRNRGLTGILATALLAISAFQLVHGRQARMYAELELLGVAAAVLGDAWLRRPRPWHAPLVGALVLLGLLTHVSMFLLGAGLLALAGCRTDREAWRWRVALAAGLAGWALLWGPSFLAQTRGGNSDWIPPTTIPRLVHTLGRLVTYQPELHVVALVTVAVGGWVLFRSDRTLGRVWCCCFLVPATLAALAGTVAPVLLDRTLTAIAWAPLLAIAFLVGAIARRSTLGAVAVVVVLALVAVPASVDAVTRTPGPDRVLGHLEHAARPGDVLALHPAGRLHELEWSLAVRSGEQYRIVGVQAFRKTLGIVRGPAPLSGRVWLLDWTKHPLTIPPGNRCAPDWHFKDARISCLADVTTTLRDLKGG